ncbi:DNA repair exonuclease [soil metagenome]
MDGNAIRVLCAGDLHIGRRSSRLPDSQAGAEHSCAAAWDAVVDTAIAERVDVVALSGDLVDRANRYFEAIGPLERGLRRLAGEGIDTYAVAGNHDYDVLRELVDTLDLERFRLLGRGGQWERAIVERDGRPTLHIDGWSFPQEQVYECALDSYEQSDDGVPVLGLLHADLDQAGSRYGPVTLGDLRRRPVALWLLGHIHGCAILAGDGGPVVIYPGTPQAMDPGEQGLHGAVIADIDPSGRVATRRAPLSTVCYLPLTIDVSDVESDDEVRSRLVTALRDALARDEHRYDRLACLSCRLTVTGRTPLHGRMREIVEAAREDLNLTGAGGAEAIVERIEYETRPALDLAAIARRNDPPGAVARIIQAIEEGNAHSACSELIDGTTRELRNIHGASAFNGIAMDEIPEPANAERFLLPEAWALLDALVAQKEAGG